MKVPKSLAEVDSDQTGQVYHPLREFFRHFLFGNHVQPSVPIVMLVLAVNQEVCALYTDLREGRPVGTVALLRIDRIAETVPDHVYFQKNDACRNWH